MIRVHVLPFVILTISLKLHKVMKFMRYLLSILTIILIQLSKVYGVPPVLNYAGQVAVNGEAFEGNGLFKFALVSDNGTSTYWSSDGTSVDGSEPQSSISVSVNGGLYSVLLGNTAIQGMGAVDPQVFAQHTDAKLRVWFSDGANGFQQLTPDRPFASVPYAFSAGNAKTAGSASIANGAVTKSMLSSEVINDISRKITMDDLDPTVIVDLNDSVADGSITTNQLSEQILKYLKPEITQQPTAGTIFADSNGTISVSAEGKYLTYQWKKNGVNLSGETNATLTITDANATLHDGNYSVVVSNDFGSVESGDLEIFIASWVPSLSENLEIWLDATDESMIVQSSNLVSLWKDKSNIGNDASQNTSTYQPTYSLDGMGGLPGLKFDSDKLQFSNNNLLNKMCFAVINPISFQSTDSGNILSSSSVNVQLRVYPASTDNSSQGKIIYVAGSPLYSQHPGALAVNNNENFINVNENSIIGFVFDETFGSSTNGIYLDTQITRNSSGSSTYNQIGMRQGTYEPYDGHIGEIIIINSVQDIDRQKVEGYLAHKWGVESKLPSDHPYKTSAP
jgi:hypothetical protein